MSVDTEQERRNMLSNMKDQITTTIQELQDIENGMHNNLANSETTENEKKQIIERINQLSNQRTALFNELKNMYSRAQTNLQEDRVDLADKLTMVNMVEGELNRTKTNYNALRDDKENKLRLVQIGSSESARYQAHIQIMKVVSFCILLIIAVSMIGKYGLLSSAIISTLIILILVFMGLYTSFKVVDIYRRNNMDFTKYDIEFPFPDDNTNGVLNPGDSMSPSNSSDVPGTCTGSSSEGFSNIQSSYDWTVFGFGNPNNSVVLSNDTNAIQPIESSSKDEFFADF